MRKHRYKAKRLDTGEWIEGYLWRDITASYYIRKEIALAYAKMVDFEVDPDTIYEFTGLYDKNKNMIYEHDIVQYPSSGYKQEVKYGIWDECGCHYTVYGWDIPDCEGIEVIGNIFDNPELLEVK